VRVMVAIAFGGVVAVVSYAALRVLEFFWFPEPDPAIVIWLDRSRFVWRVLIAAYMGGMGGLGGYAFVKRSERVAGMVLPLAMLIAGVALALQGAFCP